MIDKNNILLYMWYANRIRNEFVDTYNCNKQFLQLGTSMHNGCVRTTVLIYYKICILKNKLKLYTKHKAASTLHRVVS